MSKVYTLVSKGAQLPAVDSNHISIDDCWKQWCRLCAKEHEYNVEVYNKNDKLIDTTLATAIGKFFWIKPDDRLPQYVCKECEILVNSLCRFTEQVNNVQTMFALLANPNELVDPYNVREEYGLGDDDRQHIILPPSNDLDEYEIQSAVDEESDEDIKYNQKLISECQEYSMDQDLSQATTESDGEDALDPEIMQQIELQLEPDVEAEDFERAEVSIGASDFEFDGEEFEFNEMEFNLKNGINELKQFPLRKTYCDNKAEIAAEENDTEQSAAQGNVLDGVQNRNDNDELEKEDVDMKMSFKIEDSNWSRIEEMEEKKDFLENCEHEIKIDQLKTDTEKEDVVVVNGISIIRPPRRRRGRPAKKRAPSGCDENGPQQKKRRMKNNLDADDANEYNFTCSVCPKKYKSLTVYRKHMLEVHDILDQTVVEYNCKQCSKVFPTEKTLATHMRTHLPLELKQIHPCPYCDKRFTKDSIMMQHISGIHLNEKPYMCEECGRPLKTLAALKEHKLIHTDDCPFECTVCNRRFKNKARLKIHSDIHNDTAYKCSICGVHLNTRRTLSMHMLVHSELKAFKCDYCGNEFKRAKALKNHLIIHSGLKPYTCTFCGKSFANGSNCRSHKKKSHPVELAALEAAGKQTKPTPIPKLDHLRAVTKVAENLKPVIKQTGLPANWRELLLKAEARGTNTVVEQHTETHNELKVSHDSQDDIYYEVEAQLSQMNT